MSRVADTTAVEAQYDGLLLDQLLLAASVGINYREEFARIIKHWAGLNYQCLFEIKRQPNYKVLQEKFRKIRRLVTELDTRLSDYYVQREIWIAADEGAAGDVSGAMNAISNIKDWARVAASNAAHQKLGPQEKSRLVSVRQEAINELGHIWKLFTGKRPTRRVQNAVYTDNPRTYGPFHEFVSVALLPLFGEAGVAGIDRDIRKTCQFMDKNPDQQPPSFIQIRACP
jgi:hypothetical protein